MEHRPKSHHYGILLFEFINWALFLAVWVALADNIGKKTFCADPSGGLSHVKECDTLYAAFAFAICEWILFTVTWLWVLKALFLDKEVVHDEKTVASSQPAEATV
jgi:hypothetical protein